MGDDRKGSLSPLPWEGRWDVARTNPAYLAGVVVGIAISGSAAGASMMTQLGSVDFIDHVFAAGGGSYTKSLTGGPDDGWSVFAANLGDTITVTFSATTGTSNAPAAYDGAALLEVNDGIVAVGDAANITDFSFNRMGAGTDLIVQHPGFNLPGGSYLFGSGSSQSVTFTAAATGQYAIGVSCSDEMCVNGSTFTVQLSGNTASVPEPGIGALLGLGLAALAAAVPNEGRKGKRRSRSRTPSLPLSAPQSGLGPAPNS